MKKISTYRTIYERIGKNLFNLFLKSIIGGLAGYTMYYHLANKLHLYISEIPQSKISESFERIIEDKFPGLDFRILVITRNENLCCQSNRVWIYDFSNVRKDTVEKVGSLLQRVKAKGW